MTVQSELSHQMDAKPICEVTADCIFGKGASVRSKNEMNLDVAHQCTNVRFCGKGQTFQIVAAFQYRD